MSFHKLISLIRTVFPLRALIISVSFGLISLFTVLGGIKFMLPGTNASTDPREVFNALGAAFSGPVGGLIIASLSTLSQYNTPFHFFVFFQHSISAIWIGWAYKKFVYEKYDVTLFIFPWLGVMSVYSIFSYFPGLITLHFFFKDLWQQFVGGDLNLIDGAVKLYSGWLPEILFTIVFSSLVIIALPEIYRKPQWGNPSVRPVWNIKNDWLARFYNKYFKRNFIAVRLSLWFIILFSLPLVYIGVYIHNYFGQHSLKEEAYSQTEIVEQAAFQLEEMPRNQIPEFLHKINTRFTRTMIIVNTDFTPIDGTTPSAGINEAMKVLSPEMINTIVKRKHGSLIDDFQGISIGYSYLKKYNYFVLSFSEIREYEADSNNLSMFIGRNLFFTLIGISILSGGIIWFIVGVPLKKLTIVSAEIGRQNYDVNIDSSEMSDEISSLAETINEMKNNIKTAGTRLRDSEEKYRGLFDNANDAIFLWELNNQSEITRCLEVNEVASKMTGYSKEELISFSPYFLYPEHDRNDVMAQTENIVKNKKALFEAAYITRDSRKIDIEVSSHFFELQGKKVILSIMRDITQAKEAERALLESQHRLKTFSEATFEGIGISQNGIVVDANEQFADMLGYDSREIIGMSILDLVAPESVERVMQHLDNPSENVYEFNARKKDGLVFPVEVRIRKIVIGNQSFSFSVVRNITERKKSERDLLAAKEIAEKSNQLKSEFLAQMSHEIRSPLYTILSFFEFIKGEFSSQLSVELDSSLASVDSAGKRIIRTIDLILNMSDVQLGTFKPSFQKIDLADDVVYVLLSEYQWAAKNKGLQFTYSIETPNTSIYGDLFSVSQIISNLVDNAIKYTPDGEIYLIVDEYNSGLRVRIRDTGIGISEDYLPYLFEPFSQEEQGYSRQYEGNGLGMALVKKYCELNLAEISVKSQKGKGTEFEIIFKHAEP